MKNNQKKVFAFGDLQLRFTPKTLSLSQSPAKPLKLYLQKNVQVIGEINELAIPAPGSLRYNYSQEVKAIEFRALSPKNCLYQLSLYEVEQGTNTEKWLGDAEVDLTKFLKMYEQDFRRNDQKLQTELKEKESSLPELWRTLTQNFNQRSWQSGARFKQIHVILQFEIEPWHQYDAFVKKDDQQLAKLERQNKGKSMTRSYTQPNILKNFKSSKKGEHSAKEVKAELKKFSSEMQMRIKPPLSNIEEQEESVTSKIQERKTDGDIDRELEDQELKEIQELAHQEHSQKHLLRPEGPFVGRISSLLGPEYSAPSRLELISMGSGTEKPIVSGACEERVVAGNEGVSKSRQVAITILGFVLAVILLVFLMKPLSKVH